MKHTFLFFFGGFFFCYGLILVLEKMAWRSLPAWAFELVLGLVCLFLGFGIGVVAYVK